MKIRVLGGGWYGCHIALDLIRRGHDVELHEIKHIFSGASGNNPARLHQGQHYPRSRLTRAFCQDHYRAFMDAYGDLTHGVPVNVYAIASHDSLMDFGTYKQVLTDEIDYIEIERPEEFGLRNIEGAILTGERHIIADRARDYFTKRLDGVVRYGESEQGPWDWTIDCTFCALNERDVDRYEPCLVVLLEGPCDRAVTIMDGPFPSLYPWDETRGLSSLSSAKFTPFTKSCKTYWHARDVLDNVTEQEIKTRAEEMIASMAQFYPAVRDYRIADFRLSVRAMPRSRADARLVDAVKTGENTVRIRAGKIDAIFLAADLVAEIITS